MAGQKSIQILAVAQIIHEKKPVAGEVCPLCGGPAEVDLFWSISSENPGVRVLKKQTCCGGHPRRSSRYHSSEKVAGRCPVWVEIVDTELETPAAELEDTSLDEPETLVISLVPAQAPPLPVPRETAGELDAVLDFLSRCPDEALDEIGLLVEVTREFKARRACLGQRAGIVR